MEKRRQRIRFTAITSLLNNKSLLSISAAGRERTGSEVLGEVRDTIPAENMLDSMKISAKI